MSKQIALATRIALLTALIIMSAPAIVASDKPPRVTLKGINLQQVNWTSGTADTVVLLEVENYGPEVKIKDMRYRLKLNGQEAAEGKRDDEVNLPAAATTMVKVPLTLDLLAIPGVAWSTLSSGLNVRYDLETEFTVPVLGLFNHKVRTSFGGDLPLGDAAVELRVRLKDWLLGKP
jgi:LEA14-like dessication related protein